MSLPVLWQWQSSEMPEEPSRFLAKQTSCSCGLLSETGNQWSVHSSSLLPYAPSISLKPLWAFLLEARHSNAWPLTASGWGWLELTHMQFYSLTRQWPCFWLSTSPIFFYYFGVGIFFFFFFFGKKAEALHSFSEAVWACGRSKPCLS